MSVQQLPATASPCPQRHSPYHSQLHVYTSTWPLRDNNVTHLLSLPASWHTIYNAASGHNTFVTAYYTAHVFSAQQRLQHIINPLTSPILSLPNTGHIFFKPHMAYLQRRRQTRTSRKHTKPRPTWHTTLSRTWHTEYYGQKTDQKPSC